jgi:hypothetical protein
VCSHPSCPVTRSLLFASSSTHSILFVSKGILTHSLSSPVKLSPSPVCERTSLARAPTCLSFLPYLLQMGTFSYFHRASLPILVTTVVSRVACLFRCCVVVVTIFKCLVHIVRTRPRRALFVRVCAYHEPPSTHLAFVPKLRCANNYRSCFWHVSSWVILVSL